MNSPRKKQCYVGLPPSCASLSLCSWESAGSMADFVGGMGGGWGVKGVLGGRVSGYFSQFLAAKPCGLRMSR